MASAIAGFCIAAITASRSATSMSTATWLRFWGVDEGPDVRHTERPEDLFALGRGKPVVGVFHIVVPDDGRHDGSSGLCVCGAYCRASGTNSLRSALRGRPL